jgi:predicted transcriptional regulator
MIICAKEYERSLDNIMRPIFKKKKKERKKERVIFTCNLNTRKAKEGGSEA